MISAFDNPNLPPLMAPESQATNLPKMPLTPQQKVAAAMMQQQLQQAGQNLFTAAPMRKRQATPGLLGSGSNGY